MIQTEDPLLSIRAVTKRFEGFTAVDNISFDLQAGVIAGLIGPNGAGKTTLFNTIAGLMAPESGEILLEGKTIQGKLPHKIFSAGLARTFQIPRPFPEMSVLENVMLVPLKQSGETFWKNWLSPSKVAQEELEARSRAEEIIDFCNLSKVKSDQASTLSGGQLKLLELARVLMVKPKIILLDEPTAGVNPSLMITLIDKIKALNSDGQSFLIIEHNMDVVMSICDPITVMSQGKLLYQGDATGVSRNPAVLEAYLGDL